MSDSVGITGTIGSDRNFTRRAAVSSEESPPPPAPDSPSPPPAPMVDPPREHERKVIDVVPLEEIVGND